MQEKGGDAPGPTGKTLTLLIPHSPLRDSGQALRACKGEGEEKTGGSACALAQALPPSLVLGDGGNPAPDSSRGIGMTGVSGVGSQFWGPSRPPGSNMSPTRPPCFLIIRYQGGCDGRMGVVKNRVGLVKGVWDSSRGFRTTVRGGGWRWTEVTSCRWVGHPPLDPPRGTRGRLLGPIRERGRKKQREAPVPWRRRFPLVWYWGMEGTPPQIPRGGIGIVSVR